MTVLADSLRATKKFSGDIAKLIEPLESYFGIKQFCYAASFSNGTSVHINTAPEVSEYFAYNGLDAHDPHQVSPDNMGSGMTPWKVCGDYSDVVTMMEDDFDLAYGISYVESCKDQSEVFSFSAPKANKAMQYKMYEESKYLLKFIEYFRKEAAAIFQEVKADYLIDITAIKDNFYSQQGIIPTDADKQLNLEKLLTKMGVKDGLTALEML